MEQRFKMLLERKKKALVYVFTINFRSSQTTIDKMFHFHNVPLKIHLQAFKSQLSLQLLPPPPPDQLPRPKTNQHPHLKKTSELCCEC